MSGRGGGYKAPTGGQLFLKRSAEECGLDDRNLKTLQDITKPILFPPFKWHSSGIPWTTQDESPHVVTAKQRPNANLIRKGRDMQHALNQLPTFLRPTQEVDVERYSISSSSHSNKRTKRHKAASAACDARVLAHMGRAANIQYIPKELLGLAPVVAKDLTLEELAALELKLKDGTGVAPEGEEEEGDEDLIAEQDEEEEEAEDYVMNHYESEGDESDGGGEDAEPTF
jgi:hypothetical protein